MWNPIDLFKPKTKTIECPYCTKILPMQESKIVCDGCEREVPEDYRTNYSVAPPLYMPVIGWPKIGKTCWLYSLIRNLEVLAGPRGWNGFEFFGLDTPSRGLPIELPGLEGGTEPKGATAVLPGPPFLYLLRDMPRWGSRTLILQDLAGEPWKNDWFDRNKDSSEAILYQQQLIKNKSVMMFFSIQDMLDGAGDGHRMSSLMETYRHVLRNAGSNIESENRRILVVLTKSAAIAELDKNLRAYLQSDPIASRRDDTNSGTTPLDTPGMAEYVAQMKEVSNQLREWIGKKAPGGQQFLTQGSKLKLTLDFCLTSSFTRTIARHDSLSSKNQSAEIPGTIGDYWHCKRVLDPLFWALEMQSARRLRG